MKRQSIRRRGMMAVLAMLYVVLFAVLALGFYAGVSTNAEISHNDDEIARAQMSAESGLDFMRYQMSRVSVPPGLTGSAVTTEIYNDLAALLNNTSNMAGHTVGRNGSVISIPSTGTIKLDSTGRTNFNATITDWPEQGKVVVCVTGRSGAISRAIQMDFTRVPKKSSVFDFAVVSKGQIVLSKGSVSTVDPAQSKTATAMSAMASGNSVVVSGGTLGGDITVMDTAGVSFSKGSVGGSSIGSTVLKDHVTKVTDPPEFPTIDTDIYRQYAVNAFKSGNKTQQNIRIPANTNPSFNGGDTVQGIMFIESPNTVTFRGNFNLQGILVFDNSSAGQNSTDNLDFRGNVSQLPLPSGTAFDALRAASGIAILAPNAGLTMSGSTDSLLRGNVISNTFNFAGSADIVIDHGTLMTLKDASSSTVFAGKTVKFTGTGASNLPSTGVSFSQTYSPETGSYEELMP
jgi:hypothetical protein